MTNTKLTEDNDIKNIMIGCTIRSDWENDKHMHIDGGVTIYNNRSSQTPLELSLPHTHTYGNNIIIFTQPTQALQIKW